jgi:hypothetical protein
MFNVELKRLYLGYMWLNHLLVNPVWPWSAYYDKRPITYYSTGMSMSGIGYCLKWL